MQCFHMLLLFVIYFIKVGFYKQFLNIFVIPGCLYLVKPASIPKEKVEIMRKIKKP